MWGGQFSSGIPKGSQTNRSTIGTWVTLMELSRLDGCRAEVVVIGAGVRGCSCAYHLAKSGVRVTIVEKANIASACSGATLAVVNFSQKEPAFYTQLSLESARFYRGLDQELGEGFEYRRVGQITHLIADERSLGSVERFIQQQNRVSGVHLELLPINEARNLEPALSPDLIVAGFCAEHAYVNPYKLTLAYAKAAQRCGASIVANTNVTGIELANSRVEAVVTDRGRILTKTVILAAGVGVAQLGRFVGLTIPVVPSRGQVLTTERTGPILNRPVESFLQTADGSLLLGVTTEFVGYNNRVTYEGIQKIARQALRSIPVLRNLNVVRIWAGLRPWPIDGLPIIGFVPQAKGILLATGHSGITLAEVTGRVIAELVVSGKSSIPIEEYSLERFTSGRYHFAMECYHRTYAEWGVAA